MLREINLDDRWVIDPNTYKIKGIQHGMIFSSLDVGGATIHSLGTSLDDMDEGDFVIVEDAA